MLTLSLGLVMGMAIAAPALAQDMFPDTPQNHWAYEALENLRKEGILVGYPDGKFRGTRLATRYEMAVAINAAYKKLLGLHDGLAEQIKAIQDGMGGGDNGDLKATLEAMKAQLDAQKGWGDEIAALKKLVGEFESELTGLGNDVDGMKTKLNDLDKRVTALEARKLPVDISGDLNFLILAGNSRDRRAGMNKEGRTVGINEQTGGQTGLTRDLNIYHELAIKLKGTNEEGPKWHATLVYGNSLGTNAAGGGINGDFVNRPGAQNYSSSQGGQARIEDAVVSFDTSLAGLGFSAEIGRIGVMVSPYMFKRTDNTLYFVNDRWDDGKYRIDGANIKFGFSAVDFRVFGGKVSNWQNGTDLNAMPVGNAYTGSNGVFFAGNGNVDTLLGAQLGFNVGTMGKINAAYIYHDLDGAAAGVANRLAVYGLDAALKFGAINVNAGYSKSRPYRNNRAVGPDRLNQAAYANAGWDGSNWGIMAEYRRIQRDYLAFGEWRRIGTWWNPTNIESFGGKLYFKPSEGLGITYHGEFGKTKEATVGVAARNTNFESHNVEVNYKLNEAWNVMLGYEDFRWKLRPANLRQKWATLGLGYNLGKNSLLNIAYEYGSVSNQGAAMFGGGNRFSGGQLTTQLTVRF